MLWILWLLVVPFRWGKISQFHRIGLTGVSFFSPFFSTLRIMGSQVTGGLEIQKNTAKNPSFLEGPS